MREWRRVAIVIGAGAIAIGVILGLIDQVATPAANAHSPRITLDRSSTDPSDNLLINPGFENGFTYYPGLNSIRVPIGWNIRWYTDTPPGQPITSPYHFKQPETKLVDMTEWPFCCAANIPPRINTGRYAVESAALFANQDVALYQPVGHIPIGAVVTATAAVHAWVSSCNPFPTGSPPLPAISLQGSNANGCPPNFWIEETNHMLVGIDPAGGIDPRASSVVWNWDEANPLWWGPYDYYSTTQPAMAVAQAHTVTLFLRGVTVNPARYDNIYFDTASLIYSFPISVSFDQDQPWPLPVAMTVSIQVPVSLTAVNAVVIDPNGVSLPITLTDTEWMSPTYRSRWRFDPVLESRHLFTLTANELAMPIVQTIDVQPLRTQYVQDVLLPHDGLTPTQPVLITFTAFSPVSLTNVTMVLTDPLEAQQPITLVAVEYFTPTYNFQWQFAPIMTGWHMLSLNADQFTQPLVRSVLAASDRIYLPITLHGPDEP
jgi:hypothetical protein